MVRAGTHESPTQCGHLGKAEVTFDIPYEQLSSYCRASIRIGTLDSTAVNR